MTAWASADEHVRYSVRCPRLRRRCRLGDGCPNRATHLGMANGVALAAGCQFHVAQWARAEIPTVRVIPRPAGPQLYDWSTEP